MPRKQTTAAPGLLLDLDGTLADTLPALQAVYKEFTADHRLGPVAPSFDQLNGMPLPSIIALLQRDAHLDGDAGTLERDYRSRMTKACEHAEPKSGARELLQAGSAAGYRIAVVTSGEGKLARAWLERSRLKEWVSEIVGAGDVTEGKPGPEPYRFALRRLSASVADSIAVEDSILGAQSSITAGLKTYVVATTDDARRDSRWPDDVRFVRNLSEVIEYL